MLRRNYSFRGILNTIKNNSQINIYNRYILTELRYACRKFILNNMFIIKECLHLLYVLDRS